MKDIHANPQFRREHTLCLNGEWDFEILSSPFEDGLSERELKGIFIIAPMQNAFLFQSQICRGEFFCVSARAITKRLYMSMESEWAHTEGDTPPSASM